MKNNFEIKTKRALFLNNEQITDYDWDRFDIDEKNRIIVATNEEKHLALYTIDCNFLFEMEDCIEYEIKSKYILIKTRYIDLPLYGIISHKGEILLPFAFRTIEETDKEDVLKVKMAELVHGYYIVSTNQLILNAHDFKSDLQNEYSFLIENKWKKYILKNGEYELI